MVQRTTIPKVREILGVDYDGTRNLQPFIDAATLLMDEVVTKALTYRSVTYNTSLAERVEACLAAWAYAMSDRPLTTKSTGKASGAFAGQNTMGLEANSYGQLAIMMDTTRVLSALNKGAIASTSWLGLYPTSQTDYETKR